MATKVLVTGGSGRLGNYVSPYLKEQGYLVTNFDSKPTPPDSACEKANIPFVMGDLTNLGDCLRAIAHAQPDVIVHLAAIPFNSEIQPAYAMEYNEETQLGARFNQMMPEDLTMRTNVMGTYYILDAARRMGVKHIVAASSYFALGLGFQHALAHRGAGDVDHRDRFQEVLHKVALNERQVVALMTQHASLARDVADRAPVVVPLPVGIGDVVAMTAPPRLCGVDARADRDAFAGGHDKTVRAAERTV